jgi:catechol 2,3-dioxygenase-like lactoylglutathione lyase family enzyme
MKVKIVSIPVFNQDQALKFYTEILGFVVKHDIPLGGENRWLTVVSPDEQDGTEILLEPSPNHFEPTKVFQKALYDSGIPYTQFNVDNVQSEFDRMTELGIEFSMVPTDIGSAKIVVFEDTCGNRIQLVELL